MLTLRRNKTTVAAACVAALGALFASQTFGAEQVETRVIYPASATSPEPQTLDVRRTARPPVREEEELDCETPIGQIRDVLETLQAIRADQAQSRAALEKLLARSNDAPPRPAIEPEVAPDDERPYEDEYDDSRASACFCDCGRVNFWEALLIGLLCAACSVAVYAAMSKGRK